MAILKTGITLYFIRHGETDWNRDQRYQGQRDIALNDTGRAQARRNGQILNAFGSRIAHAQFVCSTLARAIETMAIVRTELGMPPDDFRRDRRLVELNYGHWEGLLASQLHVRDPDGLKQKAADPYAWRPMGGESYADLQDRVSAWLATLETDTVAVSHGGVSRVVRGAVLDIAQDDIPFLPAPQDKIMVMTATGVEWI